MLIDPVEKWVERLYAETVPYKARIEGCGSGEFKMLSDAVIPASDKWKEDRVDHNWPDDYPDPKLLRQDVRHMVQAIAGALRDVFGDENVHAIWFKGSAQKQWASLVDYVPALSDVDIHVLLSDETAPAFHELTTALDVQARIEENFAVSAPDALHVPRPQINLINELKDNDDYIASPAAIVETIYGRAPESGDYTDVEKIRAMDRAALIGNAAEVANIPHRAIDRPNLYQWDLLRALSWRISPLGSRLLCVSGVAPEQAWSMNRTSILASLRESGLIEIGEHWEQFYRSCWRYYLSQNNDGAAGRAALHAAADALRLAGEYAQK